jgi:type IV secretory pathway VirB3-like protein
MALCLFSRDQCVDAPILTRCYTILLIIKTVFCSELLCLSKIYIAPNNSIQLDLLVVMHIVVTYILLIHELNLFVVFLWFVAVSPVASLV